LNAIHYFEKARVAAHSAQLLLDAGDADGACNRAYYAMFDAARASIQIRSIPELSFADHTDHLLNSFC
jgi:uncharacterized protein (UPF0332 family)